MKSGEKKETERLIIDSIREADKEDYYINISHDKRVLETFICRYADTLEDFDFSSYPGRQDLFAIRLKETGRLIGIILYFDEKEDSCEIGYGIGSAFWNQGYATEAVGRFLEYLFREKGMRSKGISPLYLVTDHTGFYERYGWEFFCMVQGDGEPGMTRMYVHR